MVRVTDSSFFTISLVLRFFDSMAGGIPMSSVIIPSASLVAGWECRSSCWQTVCQLLSALSGFSCLFVFINLEVLLITSVQHVGQSLTETTFRLLHTMSEDFISNHFSLPMISGTPHLRERIHRIRILPQGPCVFSCWLRVQSLQQRIQ